MNGVVSCGFGLSNFAFAIIAQRIVNPLDMSPDIKIPNNQKIDQFYFGIVANNVKKTFSFQNRFQN